MNAEFTREAAATAAIFGGFAAGWFGWAQDDPPRGWRAPLVIGSILAILIAIAGGMLTWRHWSDGSAINSDTGPVFGIIVGIEVALAAVGALLLRRRDRDDLIPAWVALVVGVHLFPLAPLFQYPLLAVTAVLVTISALASVPVARSTSITVSAATGAAVGLVLLATSSLALVSAAAQA